MKPGLRALYNKLYSYFGPQHWWPADSAFEVMIGAVLTQNTSWANVEKAIRNLKHNNLLSLPKLYRMSERRLAALIKSAGYYNIKARRIKELLRFLVDYYKGDLKNMKAKDAGLLRKQLLSVKGIGPETADSILLYALDKPVFVVDAYTKRILKRHYFIKEDAGYDDMQNLFMQNLNRSGNTKSCRKKPSGVVELFNEYHALFVKLGKEFCLKSKPKCHICPLHSTDKEK